MNEHVYPVPAESPHIEEFLSPFLEETVAKRGLTPDEQFLIVLFGEDASERLDETIDVVESSGSVARKTLDINQLTVVSIDERRLNTFTTSLLYALLETDSEQPLQETLNGDYIADEDERKVDYYLPRLIERIESALLEEAERFRDKLEDMFPVDPSDQAAREMNDRLDKDVVTDAVIIDFLLLAAASTEDKSGVQRLLRYIREEKIDDGQMLSGGSSSVSGYSRIIRISYLINKSQFNSEFRTARKLYRDGATSTLLGLLNETEAVTVDVEAGTAETEADGGSTSPLESFYTIEQRVEGLIANQFQGNATTIAERLLRTINGTRLIQNNDERVQSSYQSQKSTLESKISELRGELTALDSKGDEFDETKIVVNTAEPDPYDKIVSLVEETNSLITRFIFGFDRASRTSVFTTLETRLDEYLDELKQSGTRVGDLLDEIRALETRRQQEVEDLHAYYDRLEATSIEVEAPERAQMVTNLESAWDEELAKLKHDLPEVDFTDDDESTDEVLDVWEQKINACRKQLDDLRNPIEQLENTVAKLEQIDEERGEIRETLSEIDDLMEEQ